MKNFLFLICLLLFSISTLIADNPKLTRANKLYDRYAYKDAIPLYEELAKQNISLDLVTHKLANCYRMVNDMSNAEIWYSRVIVLGNYSPEEVLYYAEALQENGKLEEAKKFYEEFYRLSPNDSRAKEWHQDLQTLEFIKKDNARFRVATLNVNTEFADFGAAFYLNKVVFASSRVWEFGTVHKHSWNNQPFLDLYEANREDNMSLSSVTHFSSAVNTRFHEGPVSFSADGNTLYFTRNNYYHRHKGKSSDGVVKLEIYIAVKDKEGKWGQIKPFVYNNNEYSVGHPSLSSDGKKLFFASDMPGGVGQSDIWYCESDGNGGWSKPVNCGPEVNTEGKELFPFYSETGKLFFSSDGHIGLGGLDVFYTKAKDQRFLKVKNLGSSLNSSKDDFAFVFNSKETKGYFSSNRDGGKGDDDIYTFDLVKPFEVEYLLNGIAKDKLTGEKLVNASIKLLSSNGSILSEVKTNENGEYSFSVEQGTEYSLLASQVKYFDATTQVSTKSLTEDNPVATSLVSLEKDLGFALFGLITEKSSGKPIESVRVEIVDLITKRKVIDTVTTSTGDFTRVLADKKLKDRVSYDIKVSKEGYLTKTASFSTVLEKTGVIKVHEQLSLSLEKIEVGMDLAKMIEIKPIYYDLAKYNIRNDAAVELDKIVKIMKEHPTMVIELGSHTDCRSSAAFNLKLSENRAKASVEYIISKGIEQSRITGKGYGESKLVNGCACEGTVKSTCSEEEHQRNRRTEFIIIKM